ncbi:MAG: glycosyltransferase family 39 protein [bacterium]|nr:glycosyltransferase family 39 protein [bacterium]
MKQTVIHIALLALVAGSALFVNLGGSLLWDRDEPRNAGCAQEMLARNDWVTPVFNAELRDAKPVFLYWCIMSAYSLFGVGEFAARFWSAVAAMGTVFCTYRIGRRLFDAESALLGALVLATSLMFLVAGRAATPDSLLIFFTTAALAVFIDTTVPLDRKLRDQLFAEGGISQFRLGWLPATLMYAIIGLAVLTKGPLGLLAPMAILGAFQILIRMPKLKQSTDTNPSQAFSWQTLIIASVSLAVFVGLENFMGLLFALFAATVALTVCYIIWRNEWIIALLRPLEPTRFLAALFSLRPLWGLAIVLAIAAPWYVWVGVRTEGEFIEGFFLNENLRRATSSLENHGGNVLFYPLAILIGFFPWSIFALPTVIDWIKRLKTPSNDHLPALFLLCWAGVFVGVFSLCQTKLPSYITPCYPALALLTGRFLAHWRSGDSLFSNQWMRISTSVLGVVGAGLMVAMPIFAQRYFPDQSMTTMLVAVTPFVGALAAGFFLWLNWRQSTITTYAFTAAILAVLVFGVAAPEVSRAQHCRELLAQIDKSSDQPRVAAIHNLEPSWVFYSRRPIRFFMYHEGPEVAEFLSDDDAFLIVSGNDYERIRSVLPADTEVVAQSDYFLKSTPLLLVRRETGTTR